MPRSIIGSSPRVAALLAVPAVAAVILAGCSAGQVSQTNKMRAAVPGAYADTPKGLASLRDVQIKYNGPQGYPVGGTAPLIVYIINNDISRPLVLRGVTAAVTKDGPSLGTVVLTGGGANVGVNPRATPTASGAASASAGATASASASTSASASPKSSASASGSASASNNASASASASASAGASASASASTSGSPGASAGASAAIDLTIPPNGFARLTPDSGGYLAITSITSALGPGSSAYLTFTFDGDDPAGLTVPFGIPLSAPPRIEPSNTAGE